MIRRRGVLGLLAAAVGSGPIASASGTGIGVKAAAAAIGLDPTSSPSEVFEACNSGDVDMWRVMNIVRSRIEAQRRPSRDLPPHIANKKSWSPTYKAMVAAQEQAIIEAAMMQMERGESQRAAVLAALGIDLRQIG